MPPCLEPIHVSSSGSQPAVALPPTLCPAVNDPQLQPRLEPRPADDAQFLQGVFESIARIEAQAYRLLAEKGASPVRKVYTAGMRGGGVWCAAGVTRTPG